MVPTPRIRWLALAATCLTLVPALVGCAESSDDTSDASVKIKVAASFYPLQDAAQRIGADRVVVSNLTPLGGQPHGLVPSASALAALKQAKVVLTAGSEFQPAVSDAISSLPTSTIRVDTLSGQTLAPSLQASPGARGVITKATGKRDPHTWTDPVRFQAMVQQISTALIQSDPAGKAGYEQRTKAYLAELQALDAAYKSGLGACKSDVILATHPAFGYLAEQYGLKQALAAGISPAAAADPEVLAEIGRYAKANDARTLFFGQPVPSRLAKSVKTKTGLGTAQLNPLEGLTQEQIAARASYGSLMRENLAALQAGLGCKPGL